MYDLLVGPFYPAYETNKPSPCYAVTGLSAMGSIGGAIFCLPSFLILRKIVDQIAIDNKLGDFTDNHPGQYDYDYDDNGNMIVDANKGLIESCGITTCEQGVSYNYLNLPQKLIITDPNTSALKATVEYIYDAEGNKLQKVTTVSTVTTTTTYLGEAVFENNQLQYLSHEEGRIRYKPAIPNASSASFEYDYFLKDHVESIRMVLTEEQRHDFYPAATLENNLQANEVDYYAIDLSKKVLKSSITGMSSISNLLNNNIDHNIYNNNPLCGTGSLCQSDQSQYLYQLNSNSNKTGLGITLKVMAGDIINVYGKSYYFQNTSGTGGNATIPVIDLLDAFLNAPGASSTTHAVTSSTINTPAGTSGINVMLTQQTNQSNSSPYKPRAFINVIFFDEQFKVGDNSFSISMVGANSVLTDHHSDLQNLTSPKNGYVYIYCSNESPVNVFFDNLQVVHTRSPILEETHYYPFGLPMASISSRAAETLINARQYQGTFSEFEPETMLNNFELRNYDAQIGRFIQVDPYD